MSLNLIYYIDKEFQDSIYMIEKMNYIYDRENEVHWNIQLLMVS